MDFSTGSLCEKPLHETIMANENILKLQAWLSFLKWFMSTVVITGGISYVTLMTDIRDKESQIDVRIQQQEQEYLSKYVDKALDGDIETRYRLAQYLSTLTTTKKYKQAWQDYLSLVEKEIPIEEEKLRALEKSLLSKQDGDIKNVEDKINSLRREIEYVVALKSEIGKGGNAKSHTNSSIVLEGIKAELVNCTNLVPNIRCILLFTSQANEKELTIYANFGSSQSRIFSLDGYVAIASSVKLAGKSDSYAKILMPTNAAIRVVIEFKPATIIGSKLALLQVKTSNKTIEFRNIEMEVAKVNEAPND